jgi:hypothetical protein
MAEAKRLCDNFNTSLLCPGPGWLTILALVHLPILHDALLVGIPCVISHCSNTHRSWPLDFLFTYVATELVEKNGKIQEGQGLSIPHTMVRYLRLSYG